MGGVSAIEDDAAVLPLPLVDWKFADDWKFHLGVETLANVGYGFDLSWAMSDSWGLSFGASAERQRFRLDNSAGDPSGGEAVAEDTSLPIFVKIGYHPNPDIDINLIGTVAVGGELRVENSRGCRPSSSGGLVSASICRVFAPYASRVIVPE